MAGGGVRTKDGGIDHVTITQVGTITKASPLFIVKYPNIGEMTIGTIIGKDNNGTLSDESTMKFRKTGTSGKKIGIGKKIIIGASRKNGRIRIKDDNSKKRIN